jgi:hypothetical protein
MTNAEKYKTAKERSAAFVMFCGNKGCQKCPLQQTESTSCRFAWLELEAPMSAKEVADILEEQNKWYGGVGVGVCAPYTPKDYRAAIDRAIEILRSVND